VGLNPRPALPPSRTVHGLAHAVLRGIPDLLPGVAQKPAEPRGYQPKLLLNKIIRMESWLYIGALLL
jgi:hypothetical protein